MLLNTSSVVESIDHFWDDIDTHAGFGLYIHMNHDGNETAWH